MWNLIFGIIILIVIVVLKTIFDEINHGKKTNLAKKEDKNINQNKIFETKYYKKQFMSKTELIFYNKLLEVSQSMNVKIVPQICLNSIVQKENHGYNNELYRCIDFGIVSNDYTTPLLMIELNDSTHNNKKRKERDLKVKYICESAGIKLITFYTNRIYDEGEIQKILKAELDKIINSNES